MHRTNIHVVASLMAHYLDGDVQVPEAGVSGSTLTLVRKDGTVVALTETDGPFGLIDEDGFTAIDGFCVGVYGSWEQWEDGTDPIWIYGDSYEDPIAPTYDALTEILETVGKEATR